ETRRCPLARLAGPQGDPADRRAGRHRLGALPGVLGAVDRSRAGAQRIRRPARGARAYLAARAAGRCDRPRRPVADEPSRQFDDERSAVVSSLAATTAAGPAATVAAITPADHECPLASASCARDELAGAPGFEPGNGGIKIRCLTTWLRPTR